MSELFKNPPLQATISPAGWRSVKVATQQAAPSPLIDLAQSLGVASKVGQQVAGLQAFEYKQGVKEGEIAAASADLDEALTSFDTIGEDLVEKGLMPRSQLAGYQIGYRRKTGQREAKSSFYRGLQGRLKEVELNPENGNFDVIDQIIQDEETKSLERLRQAGGAQLALQGFSEYSSEVKDRFKIQATEIRDRAIQKHSENLHIEDFNSDFGPRLLEAGTPEQLGVLQNDMKSRMDELTSRYKIPRSRVIELFWNGFAVPNINNLLAADNPQPDKAEKMLGTLLDIDLTGKGGKLGNINREGADIRSKAVEIRNKIEASRRAIDNEEGVRAKDIVNLFMPAATSIMGGFTGRPEIDKYAIESVVDFLKDAGWDEEYANNRAEELIRNQDIESLKFEGLKYRDNDVTKGAWNAATGSINDFTIRLVQKTNAVMPLSEREAVLDEVEVELAKDPKANVKEILSAKQIADPRVIAQSIELSREAKANIWFEGTESFKNFDGQFEKNLDSIIDADLFQDVKEAAVRKDLKAGSRALFQEQYMNELRVLQSALKDDPERDVKIAKAIPGIQKDVAERWRDFKNVEKQFREGKITEIVEDQKDGIEFEAPEIPDLEEAVEDIGDVLNSWSDRFLDYLEQTASSFFLGPTADIIKTQEERDRILSAEIPMTAAGREVAFTRADFVNEKLQTEEYKDNQDLKDGLKVLRQFYGFRNPSEIPADEAIDFDFRFTPMYDNKVSLTTEAEKALEELLIYLPSAATLDIDDFPAFKLYNETFGINSEAQIKFFVETQKKVLDLRNQ